MLFDAKGQRFTPSHTWKKNRCYRYYISQASNQSGRKALRLPAKEIEAVVLNQMTGLVRSPQRLAEFLSLDSSDLQATTRSVAEHDSDRTTSSALLGCVENITVDDHTVLLAIDCSVLRRLIGLGEPMTPTEVKKLLCSATLNRVGAELRFEGTSRTEISAPLFSAHPSHRERT